MGTVRLHRPDVALGTKYLPFISFLATLVAAGGPNIGIVYTTTSNPPSPKPVSPIGKDGW